MDSQPHWDTAVASSSMSEPCSAYSTPGNSMAPSARTSATEELVVSGTLHGNGKMTDDAMINRVVESVSLLEMYDPNDTAPNRAHLRLSNQSLSSSSYLSSRPVSTVSSVSSTCGEPQNQVVLNYANMQLTECPNDVNPDVTALSLSFNKIVAFPIQFFQPLSKLRVLDLSGNGLRTLPRDIGLCLLQLRELRLSKNMLEFLPPSIGALEELELLDLGWNMLEMIDPRLFQNMRNLQCLWLQHNRLQTLPPSIGLLGSSLTEILLDGNPFTAPIDEYTAPLLLLNDNWSSSFKANRTSRDQFGAIKGSLRKSTSIDTKMSMKSKHWNRTRLTLARSRTKSLAMSAPFFHIHNNVNGFVSPSEGTSPSHTRPSSINETINEEYANHTTNEPRDDKSGKKGLFRRMRNGSFTGNRPEEFHSKSQSVTIPINSAVHRSPQLNAVQVQSMHPLVDEQIEPYELDSVTSDAESKLRRSWRTLRKPLSFGSDLNTSAQSPTRSPLASPYRVETGRECYFPSMTASTGEDTQVLRDSGYSADVRRCSYQQECSIDEDSVSSFIFSDEERAALSNADDGTEEFDNASGFIVSEEVAALAAATKAAFMRRGRKGSSGSIRQRSSTPTLRENYNNNNISITSAMLASNNSNSNNSNNIGNVNTRRSHHRSTSFSRTVTCPTSPLASEYCSIPLPVKEEQPAMMIDTSISGRQHQSHSNATSITTNEEMMVGRPMSYETDDILSPDEQLQAHAQNTMASFEASFAQQQQQQQQQACIDPNGMDPYSAERRLAMKRLLFYLRDIWDLGVGLQMLKNDSVNVRMLQSQPDASLAEDIVGDRPLSLDVNGLLRLAERRRRIIDEIISTERTYVHELGCLERFYLRPALNRGALTADETRVIFSNIESLAMFHREHFLPKLEEACEQVEPGNDPPIGQVFMNHSAYIKMYSVYVNNFEHAHVTLDKWEASKSHKRWRQLMEEARAHRSHSQLNIQGYLVMPVQRIPRYRLLLQELFDHTPHTHPDYQSLKSALDEVSKRADEINERKRDHEQCNKVLELQKMIKGSEKIPLLQPHRRFVRKFVLRSARESRLHAMKRIRFNQPPAMTIRHRRIDKEYHFFVFCDILVQCKVHGHLNKEMELVRCIRLGGRQDQIELLEEENEVRIVDEDAIVYVTGTHSELVDLMNSIAHR